MVAYRTLDSSNHLQAVPWAYTASRHDPDNAVLDLALCGDYLDMVLEAPSLCSSVSYVQTGSRILSDVTDSWA